MMMIAPSPLKNRATGGQVGMYCQCHRIPAHTTSLNLRTKLVSQLNRLNHQLRAQQRRGSSARAHPRTLDGRTSNHMLSKFGTPKTAQSVKPPADSVVMIARAISVH